MASTLPRLPLFDDISRHDPSSTAIVHSSSGRAFTYGQLLRDVSSSRRKLEHEIASGKSLEGERVAFLVENSYDYVGAHGFVLPLTFHPRDENILLVRRSGSQTGLVA